MLHYTVLEHDRIPIKSHRDESSQSISEKDATLLLGICIDDKNIFVRRNNYLYTQQWIGVISISGLSIEILPKIYGSYSKQTDNIEQQISISEIRRILLNMLYLANDIPFTQPKQGNVSLDRNGFQELLIYNYLILVKKYLEYGMIYDYEKISANKSFIKGKLNINKLINCPQPFPCVFPCNFSKFIYDNKYNQLIKAVLNEMLHVSMNDANKKEIKKLLLSFSTIKNIPISQAAKFKFSFNSINNRIKSIIEYSHLFIHKQSFCFDAGNNSIQLMLFDMNLLYQLFIYKCLKMIYGNNVVYQYCKEHLLNGINNEQILTLKPDLLIKHNGTILILDTKWKKPSRIDESDVYQMNAYVTSLSNAQKVCLLYPYSSEITKICGSYQFIHNTYENHKKLEILSIDLCKLTDLRSFIVYLKQLFDMIL